MLNMDRLLNRFSGRCRDAEWQVRDLKTTVITQNTYKDAKWQSKDAKWPQGDANDYKKKKSNHKKVQINHKQMQQYHK